MRAAPLLLVLAALVTADTVDGAADAVLAAARGDEPAELRALAARDEPDPWLVAAALAARGELDAAEAFARAAPRADTAALPDALAAWRKQPPAEGAWKRLDAAAGALSRDDGEAARADLEGLAFPEGTIAHARLLAARARASGRAADFAATAAAAANLGWLRLAAEARGLEAGALARAGDLKAAAAAARERLAVEQRRGLSADLPAALAEAGRLHLRAKRLPEAEDLLRRALRQAQRADDAGATARAEALLGAVLAERGARQDARAYLLRARAALPAGSDESFAVLARLVALDRAIDGVDRGLARAREMLDEARKAEAPAAEGVALAALARMQLDRGDLRAASERLAEAEAAYRRAERPVDAARAGAERGELALEMGRREEAGAILRAALALAGADGPAPLRARLHAALGAWAIETGSEKVAAGHLDEAAKLAAEIGDRALAARTLARRGRLALRRKQFDKARDFLTRALAEERTTPVLLDLAELAAARGDAEDARRRAGEAAESARDEGSPALLAQAVAIEAGSRLEEDEPGAVIDLVRKGAREALAMQEERGAGADARFEAALDQLLLVATDAAVLAGDAGTLLTAGELGRARRMLHALGGRGSLMAALTPEDLAKAIESKRAEEKRALAEYQRNRERMSRAPMQRAAEKVRRVRAELAKLEERRLAALSPASWLLSPGVPTIEEVQAALAPNETLLYFCVGTREVAVLSVTPAGVSIVQLGGRPAVDERIRELREALREDDPYPALKAYEQNEMVRFALPAGREVVLVTAHPFDHVPFAAVAPEQTVRYVASAADLVRLAAEGTRTGTGVLGVGDPAFDGDEARLRLVHLRSGVPIRKLEKGAALAEAIGDAVLVGPRASEAGFRDTIGLRDRWRAVHFALPGLLDARAPWRSSLSLAAGAEHDGLMTAHDFLRLGVPADVTALAACEPAKGTRDAEPAVLGMTQALHLAGSSRVIVSQWWIDDDAASTLMKHFYRFWIEGETPAPLALRRAQQKVSGLPGWIHPKSWAGWQLWGAR